MEPRAPSMMPMDEKLENPHKAYVDIISALTYDKQEEQLLYLALALLDTGKSCSCLGLLKRFLYDYLFFF